MLVFLFELGGKYEVLTVAKNHKRVINRIL
ncbi:MAG: hypothetical protein ACI8QD_000099 [Cyclobacteriaceae bacterium]|jgi:hypothetical protein